MKKIFLFVLTAALMLAACGNMSAQTETIGADSVLTFSKDTFLNATLQKPINRQSHWTLHNLISRWIRRVDANAVKTATKGQINGVAPLNAQGQIPVVHIPTHGHAASQVTGLATVATTGNFDDLTNKPAAVNLSAINARVDSSNYKINDEQSERMRQDSILNANKVYKNFANVIQTDLQTRPVELNWNWIYDPQTISGGRHFHGADIKAQISNANRKMSGGDTVYPFEVSAVCSADSGTLGGLVAAYSLVQNTGGATVSESFAHRYGVQNNGVGKMPFAGYIKLSPPVDPNLGIGNFLGIYSEPHTVGNTNSYDLFLSNKAYLTKLCVGAPNNNATNSLSSTALFLGSIGNFEGFPAPQGGMMIEGNSIFGLSASPARGRIDVVGVSSESIFGGFAGYGSSLNITNSQRLNYANVMLAKNLTGQTGSDNFVVKESSPVGYNAIELAAFGTLNFYGDNNTTTGGSVVTPKLLMSVNGATGLPQVPALAGSTEKVVTVKPDGTFSNKNFSEIAGYGVNSTLTPAEGQTIIVDYAGKDNVYQKINAPTNCAIQFANFVIGGTYTLAFSPQNTQAIVQFLNVTEKNIAVSSKSFSAYQTVIFKQVSASNAEIISIY